MKQAFLITAYTDFALLKNNIELYSKGGIDCYIHIDRKSFIPQDLAEWARCREDVHIYSRYRVNWGSYKHIMAVLYLIKIALKKGDYSHFHIISANSFITKPVSELLAFFAQSPGQNYLQVIDLEEDDVNHVIDPWFKYYHFLHIYDKRTKKGNNIDYYFEKIQKRLGVSRKKRYRYKGLLYSHLSREFVIYVLDYIKKNPRYLRNLKMCNISEEFFFQNIIMYSPYKDTVYNDHLTYDIWNSGGVAQFLTESDYDKIQSTGCLFARKFGAGSEKLYQMLSDQISGD